MTRGARPGDFVGRLEQSIARAVVGGKAVSFAHLLVNYVSSRGRIPRPRLSGLFVALAGLESAAGIVRTVRRGRAVDSAVGTIDALAAAMMIAGEAAAWGTRAFPPDPRLGLPHALTVGVFLPAMLPDRSALLRALAIPTATFVAASSSQAVGDPAPTRRALRLSETLVMPVSALFSHRLTDELRRLAAERDRAEAAAILAASRLAAERERQRQYRFIHDSPLQFLEAVGGGWGVDEGTLMARIDDEIEALEHLESASLIQSDDFGSGVRRLAERFGDLGLDVGIELPEPAPSWWLQPGTVDALLGGLHEALVNVYKHSGTDHAAITIDLDDERLAVLVTDCGRGFDPAIRRAGFGIDRSILRRMEEVGGGGSVTSRPGDGTEVTLWVTSGSPSS